MTQTTTWFAVVIEGEGYPEVIGPFRNESRAEEIADKWNTDPSADGWAHVRPMKRSLAEVDD